MILIACDKVLDLKVEKYGDKAHIIVPKKFVGKKLNVCFNSLKDPEDELVTVEEGYSTGSWLGGYLERYGRPGKPKKMKKKLKVKRKSK